ncbi:MAG: arylesterase, partial [Pseudodonghicola sp.]
LAAEHGALFAASFFEGLQEVSGDPAALQPFMQGDGIHPNAEGVKRIVAALGPKVLELVRAAQ